MAKGRKKPLHGAKKYSLVQLNCTHEECEEDFYVSLASTPAKRYCELHWNGRKKSKKDSRPNTSATLETVLSYLNKQSALSN